MDVVFFGKQKIVTNEHGKREILIKMFSLIFVYLRPQYFSCKSRNETELFIQEENPSLSGTRFSKYN